MPFPESPRAIFARNVLVSVVCQLRYPAILAIAAEPPAAFQEKIRAIYPLYRRDDGVPVPPELGNLLGRLRVQVPDTARHIFSAASGHRDVFTTQDFLAIEDREYSRWELFRAELESVSTAFAAIYKPAFYTRVGLRYQDVIDRAEIPELAGCRWDELINAKLMGALGASELRDSVTEIVTQAVLRIDGIVGGYVRLQHGLKRPEGAPSKEVYFFDADFFVESRSSHDDAFAALAAFNRHSGNLFRWAITPKLSAALRPNAIPAAAAGD